MPQSKKNNLSKIVNSVKYYYYFGKHKIRFISFLCFCNLLIEQKWYINDAFLWVKTILWNYSSADVIYVLSLVFFSPFISQILFLWHTFVQMLSLQFSIFNIYADAVSLLIQKQKSISSHPRTSNEGGLVRHSLILLGGLMLRKQPRVLCYSIPFMSNIRTY